MAIIVHDEVMTEYGVTLPDLIVSCQGTYSVSKNGNDLYRVSSNVVYKVAANSKPVKFDSIHIDVAGDALTGNLFTALYTHLKSLFQSTDDAL